MKTDNRQGKNNKLSLEQVKRIKFSEYRKGTAKALAEMYGCDVKTIYAIWSNYNWKWVTNSGKPLDKCSDIEFAKERKKKKNRKKRKKKDIDIKNLVLPVSNRKQIASEKKEHR